MIPPFWNNCGDQFLLLHMQQNCLREEDYFVVMECARIECLDGGGITL